jgi:surface polysaccharide O-acyltransferase-like enzyme
MPKVTLYWPAIVVAAIVSFLFEAIWYSIFMSQWLVGIGRTQQWLMSQTAVSQPVQFGTALICSIVVAIGLTALLQATGAQTAKRGVILAIVCWLAFFLTGFAKEYIFEVRTLQIFAINTLYGLLDYILIGAIVGGWKARPSSR